MKKQVLTWSLGMLAVLVGLLIAGCRLLTVN